MTENFQGEGLPDGFSGQVRLFPLPNLVLFPHVLQPLHVFEPRYVELAREALADDRLIAMGLLQPGWESQYDGRPPIYPVVCLGRIVSHSQQADGRFNLLLRGVRRATMVRELPATRPFRSAEVAVLEDLYPASGAFRRGKLRRTLMDCFRKFLADWPSGEEHLQQLNSQRVSLGALTDIVAYSLCLELASKQELLAEWNVDLRAERLLDRLQQLGGDARLDLPQDPNFPPLFSRN